MKEKGFTLVELLVVIGLITMMLVVGTVSFAAYLSEQGIRLGSRTVSNAFRAARQIAVSQRVVTAVVFDPDPDGDGDYANSRHRIEIRRYDAVRSDTTNTLVFALRMNPDEAFNLPGTLGLRWIPKEVEVYINDDDGSGNLQKDVFHLIDFFPDGSSRFGNPIVIDLDNPLTEPLANHVAVSDRASGKIVYLYLYPVTSFIKETYMEASE